MACCSLCRPKIKSTNKTNKNITAKKINTIDMWIENIEGPYELIDLPSKPSSKPKTITNKEEIDEAQTDHYISDINISTKTSRSNNAVFTRNILQSAMTENNSVNNP
jgi:hypothetical protein